MKIIAFHNREDIAVLLAEVEQITQVKIETAQNIGEFEKKVKKGKFDVAVVLDQFFEAAAEVLLNGEKAPKTICVLLQNEEDLSRFLRLGVAETNVEYLPFNPLTFLVKLKGLQTNILHIKEAIAKGHINFDFYRFGLFNVLNVLTGTDKSFFLSVKDDETDEVLYSLHIERGQVVGANTDLQKIIDVNLDDGIPKRVAKDPLEYPDAVNFKNTVHLYRSLLAGQLVAEGEVSEVAEEETEMELPLAEEIEDNAPPKALEPTPEEIEEVEEEVEEGLEPVRIESLRINPFRERRVYSFPYKNYLIFSQPYEALGGGKNAICVIPTMDDYTLATVKILRVKNRRLKFLTCPLIKNFLKLHGFKEENFAPTSDVAVYQFPFLSSKFECAFHFSNGILITGNLFGSYVSRNVPYLKEVFLSHLRVFHRANISSRGKLDDALVALGYIVENLQYIIPAFGYPIPKSTISPAYEELKKLKLSEDYVYLDSSLTELKKILNKDFRSFEEFLEVLKKEKPEVLFNLMDEMDALDIVPFEF
ncbi:MAG TPA: hypothetical protein EYO62_00730 [Aquificales bacterium]|nr:hypothetical protein [Aquificales bacterium]